jgi:hypothetical protein
MRDVGGVHHGADIHVARPSGAVVDGWAVNATLLAGGERCGVLGRAVDVDASPGRWSVVGFLHDGGGGRFGWLVCEKDWVNLRHQLCLKAASVLGDTTWTTVYRWPLVAAVNTTCVTLQLVNLFGIPTKMLSPIIKRLVQSARNGTPSGRDYVPSVIPVKFPPALDLEFPE